jgi:integrase
LLVNGWYPLVKRVGMTCESTKASGKYILYSLRHFYASLMIHYAVTPKRLQALMGHATISMTMDTYGHLFPTSDEDTVRMNRAVAATLAA